MKRLWWAVTAVVVASLVVTAFVVWSRRAEALRGRERREASYRAALKAFSEVIRPGMSRKEVETYLQERERPFLRMCCMYPRPFRAMDVLTRIGEEEPPFYCESLSVYIGFEFKGPTASGLGEARDDDVLVAVRIFHWREGCL